MLSCPLFSVSRIFIPIFGFCLLRQAGFIVTYPVQAEVGSSGGYSWVRIFVAGVQRYAAVLADRCRLVTLSPGDAFASCVAQGGDAAGQRAQRDGRQAGAYAQRTEASGTAPGV